MVRVWFFFLLVGLTIWTLKGRGLKYIQLCTIINFKVIHIFKESNSYDDKFINFDVKNKIESICMIFYLIVLSWTFFFIICFYSLYFVYKRFFFLFCTSFSVIFYNFCLFFIYVTFSNNSFSCNHMLNFRM